jgi:ABC-type multidrug transport system fused ATPase/permease subunit
VLVQVASAPLALLADAGSFAVSALLLRGLPPLAAPARPADRVPLRRQIAEGLAFCLRHPVIRGLVLGGAWLNFWGHALLAVFVTYAVRDLGLSAAVIGVVLASANVGYLLGSLLAPRLNRRLGVGPVVLVGVLLHGGLLAVALAPAAAPLPWLIAGFGVQSLGVSLWNVNAVSLRQASTPEPLLARMNATSRFLLWGAMPLGSVAGGLLATVAGLSAAVLVAAIAVPLVAAWLAGTPLRTVRALPAEGEPAPPLDVQPPDAQPPDVQPPDVHPTGRPDGRRCPPNPYHPIPFRKQRITYCDDHTPVVRRKREHLMSAPSTTPVDAGRGRPAQPAAAVVDAVKSYGTGEAAVRALDGVSVAFERGRFTAIMGPSGSGKSTLDTCTRWHT